MRFRAVPNWGHLPDGWTLREVAGVATDSQDRVYVYNRGDHPVIIFDTDGNFLDAWGQGQFVRPHGITITPSDEIWLTDDKDHTVRKYSTSGKLLQTLGISGQHSDTGFQEFDYRTIEYGGPPFYYPTNVALNAAGDLFITDGYGNARVHHFTARGQIVNSWGEPGVEAGQFQIPHGIALDAWGAVVVADRENSRLQFFSQEGAFVGEITGIARPCNVCVDDTGHLYVAEVGYQAGLWRWLTKDTSAPSARVSVFDPEGHLVTRWGNPDPMAIDGFFALHDICLDSHGSLYLGEVTISAGGKVDYPCLRKYERLK